MNPPASELPSLNLAKRIRIPGLRQDAPYPKVGGAAQGGAAAPP